MMRIVVLAGMLLLGGIAVAAECPVGYLPPTAAFRVSVKDLAGMELSDRDRLEAVAKIAQLEEKENALREDFREKATTLSTLLAGSGVDRSEADILTDQMVQAVEEISEYRVTYALEMAELIKVENVRRIRTRSAQSSAHCEGGVPVPGLRYALTGRHRALIGMSIDEARYVKDFVKREVYFRSEHNTLRQQIDAAVRARNVDRPEVVGLLRQLSSNVRQRTVNLLDRYFYAEKVLFSTSREAKLQAFQNRHQKHTVQSDHVRQQRKVAKTKVRTPGKKKWYWPF